MAEETKPQAQSMAQQVTGLVRALVHANLLSEADAKAALAETSRGNSFIGAVIAQGKLNEHTIAKFAAEKFGYPLLDMTPYDPSHVYTKEIKRNLLTTHRILPIFKRGNRLAVAMSDPTNLQVLEELRFQTNLFPFPVVVEHSKLEAALAVAKSPAASLNELENADGEEEFEAALGADDDSGDDDDGSGEGSEGGSVDDAPIVKFIRKILIDAINSGASDIHFEPYEKFYRIRYRIDGELREIMQPPLAVRHKLAARIKVISRINIAEKRIPQDGRTRIILGQNKAIDFRVSTLPTLHGEKIVMRILDPSSATLGIDALGYEPEQKRLLLEAVSRPYGMVLVTGPTGSGKTVSLYTCLNILNKPGTNISTAEDPAEINLAGINQVNVDDKAGLTFSAALKSFLRQDPDIIMVGEIRDLETAEIAIKAAQTGHLVLSTLHTNDAPQTLTRLMNMGVPAFNIASSVHLITAQRLGRRLCKCKVAMERPPAEALIEVGFSEDQVNDPSWTMYKPGSCDVCKGSGYKGRVGIYQVMPVTEAIQEIILSSGSSLDIARQSRSEGVLSLREAGITKVILGMTSLEEVTNTTNV